MYEYVSATKLLDDLKDVDYILFSQNTNINWTEATNECKQLAFDNQEYSCSILPDDDNWEVWDEYGEQTKKSQNACRDWGYNQHNTNIWKTTGKQPALEFSWHNKMVESLPLANGAVATPTQQMPGQVLPWHIDLHSYAKRLTDTKDHHKIVRFLTFMEDWKTGHYFQAGNSVVTHWSAGDTIIFSPARYHIGANVGIEPKWTCNTTGILK